MKRFQYANPAWDKASLQAGYPDLSHEIDLLPTKYGRWVEDRFLSPIRRTEIHPLQDVLPTLRAYHKAEASIAQKYKENKAFKKDLDASFPQHKWSSPTDITHLTADDMEVILGLSQRGKQRFEVSEDVDVSQDFVGKFGVWNLWMPTTRENSVIIAGRDPTTYKPCTTWCTTDRQRGLDS